MSGSTDQITQYYPTLQPLLADIQQMIPAGQSTATQQSNALNNIANTYTAESPEFRAYLESSLEDKVDKYIGISHRLNDFNEIYNTNKYIDKELRKEQYRIDDTTNKLKNKIYISKQKAQMYEYETNKLKFYKNLFLLTVALAITLMVFATYNLNNYIAPKAFYVLTGIAVFIYIVIVFVLLYANSYRSHTDWNKYNWGNISNNSNGQSCPMINLFNN
jgi:lipopolysaccharide export LptBFGC system permease protein LptF